MIRGHLTEDAPPLGVKGNFYVLLVELTVAHVGRLQAVPVQFRLAAHIVRPEIIFTLYDFAFQQQIITGFALELAQRHALCFAWRRSLAPPKLALGAPWQ